MPVEGHIPQHGRLPSKVYWQVQAYLRFTERRYAHIIYLARDTGLTQVLGQRCHEDSGAKVAQKLERVVRAVQECERPACTCGKCGRNGHE